MKNKTIISVITLLLLFTFIFAVSIGGRCAYSVLPIDPVSTNDPLDPAYRHRIFLTVSEHNGNFGGIVGADAFCAADVNNPNDGQIFKAMVMGGGRDIINDWVLKPDKKYYRMNRIELIGTTNGLSKFITPLTHSISLTNKKVWTGMENNYDSGLNCTNWTTTGGNGLRGISNRFDFQFFSENDKNCHQLKLLYCVEQ